MSVRHIYIHVPFCDGKCLYCAFYSRPCMAADADAWLRAVSAEIGRWTARFGRLRPLTIYLGGGTPTVLSCAQIESLCGLLRDACRLDRLMEWTFEANPGTLDGRKLDILGRAGVNRISLGVQSMSDRVLARAGRRHGAEDVRRTWRMLGEAGFCNAGMDLIAGLPGAGPATWRDTLDEVVEMRPSHVSVYALSVEEGSTLHRTVRDGIRRVPSEKAASSAVDEARRRLTASGYERYEVSNYGRDGRRCLHNLACWRGRDYVGFGPAAASRVGRERWTVPPDLGAYLDAAEHGDAPAAARETLDERTDAAERLMFAFRMGRGIDARRVESAPAAWRAAWANALVALAADGLIARAGSRWAPTEKGFLFADRIASAFL